ncbi:hypothetical protein EJB05_35960, partial [Eragrostis curvula]
MDPRELLRAQAVGMVVVLVALVVKRFRYRSLEDVDPVGLIPRSEADAHRMKNLNLIYNSTDGECVDMLRMRKAPFFSLCDLFRQRGLLLDTINSSIEEQVSLFLHVVGHNQRFRVVHQSFRRSKETISRQFRQVLYAVGELRNEMIRPPSQDIHPKILGSHRWNPFFKDCIGAIDGTHILARVPLRMQAAFRGRKHQPTQNVMAAVNWDLMFTYVLAGWEGSAHDAHILVDALERDDGLRVPAGNLIVDAGYACRPGFLPPFRGVRYHLSEYTSRNNPTNARELFNLRHSSLRVHVERAFGALKGRFRILDNKPYHPYRTQVKLVLACCILHNWILTFGAAEVVPPEATFLGAPQENEPLPPSNRDATTAETNAWAAARDLLANAMWDSCGSSRI